LERKARYLQAQVDKYQTAATEDTGMHLNLPVAVQIDPVDFLNPNKIMECIGKIGTGVSLFF
jgi:hypothetical protein